MDAPANTAFPIFVNRHFASVGLLQLNPQQEPAGYLYHVNLHLIGLTSSAQVSDAYRTQVQQIVETIKSVNTWLEQIHQDARKLVMMSDSQLQLATAQTLLNDMVTKANSAYFGTQDPSSGQTQEGIEWVYRNVQHLAVIDITPYR